MKKMMFISMVAEANAESVREFFKKHVSEGFDELDAQHFNKLERPPHRVDNWFGHGILPSNHKAFLIVMDSDRSDVFREQMRQCSLSGEICEVRTIGWEVELL